ncbi:MAG: colanic acid/amylovoran biosynthesis glycosyltransferase [Planctomycetota bacterium]|jgi:colanic acid/amylovoran biosynthesis glycosyltransferase
MRITYLAPEIPSVSATFVYHEMTAHTQAGHDVQAVALRQPNPMPTGPEAEALSKRTRLLYSAPWRMLADATVGAVQDPVRALSAIALAIRDMVRGDFPKAIQRWKVPMQLTAAFAIARHLRKHRSEHLHVHFAHAPATVGMYAARAAGVPFSVTSHANDLFVEGSLLAEKMLRAQSFLTVTEENRRELIRKIGQPACLVRVHRCGVDLEQFAMRRGSSTSDGYVLAVGRLVAKKGFDDLIHAFAAVSKEHPDIRLVIAGEGPERHSLERLAQSLHMDHKVILPGSIAPTRVRALLDGAQVFCLPCRPTANGDRDALPVALMEAMASGVPVVTTTLPGIPELVDNHVNGLTVPPQDRVALAGALRTIFSQPQHAAKMVGTARTTVEERFDLRRNAEQLVTRFRLRVQQPALATLAVPFVEGPG